ncbi:hypothetical protein NQ314_013846 [Rhamnusium bicolor]|uniref:Heparan-sulfate 6-O-sulfotransferase n=1 Tax=Rhamnusium bicolor TaxID=1586634 RepID=A0AAV8X430_9CUCU|nr:hypothetical protein NQ314_013846 [Rhamnusium bicolor]
MKNLKSVSVQVVDSDIAVLLPNGVYEIKQMETKSSRLKQICLFCLALCVFGIFGFGYFCPDKVCALSSKERVVLLEDNLGKPLAHTNGKSKKMLLFSSPHSNQSWLFSRYTTGWKCGLHADWTELTSCVDEKLDELEDVVKRRYFYITLLREPVSRYLSEFRHVQRGATWKGSRHFCKGRIATNAEVPPCYEGDNWEGVQIDEFIDCERCYDKSYMSKSDRDRIMLASAKKNLQSMAFFGLTEYQKISQYIFEETFNLRFAIPFEQNNATVSSSTMTTFEKLKARDSDFDERFKHLGELTIKNGPTEFDWDKLEDPTESSN